MPTKSTTSSTKAKKPHVSVVVNRAPSPTVTWLRSKWAAMFVVLVFAGIGAATFAWARAATTTSTLWSTKTVPRILSDSDSQSVELGVKFKSKYASTVLGMRYYKGPQNTGTHSGSLWTSDGKELTRVLFKDETASGWQTATFAQPVAIAANTTYIVSYHASKGHYSADNRYFTAAYKSSDGVLTAPKNAGVYTYGNTVAFPATAYQSSNYWVDPIVSTSRFIPTPKPTPPSGLAATVNQASVKLTWNASPTSGITGYNIVRNGAALASVVPGTLSYVDTSVAAGTAYSYQVAAVTADGTTSDLTDAVSAKIPANAPTPPPPTNPNPTPTPPAPTPPSPPTGSAGCTPSVAMTFMQCGFPNASTTGVPSGTKLVDQTAAMATGLVITQDNTVIDGLNLNGWIDVEANNVTIKNSVITSNNWWGINYGRSKPNVTGLRLLHNKITSTPGKGPDNGGYDYAVNQNGTGSIEAAYNDISGFKDGTTIATNANIHDNYIHDLSQFSGAHTQGIYVYSGAAPVNIENNTIVNQTGSGYTTAAIYIAPDSANHNNVTVKNNWLSGGAFTLYGGDTNAKNIKVLNNLFSTETFPPNGSLYGPIGYWFPNNSGNTWSGNVWANGSKAGQAINP